MQGKVIKKIKKAIKDESIEPKKDADPIDIPDFDRRFAVIHEHIRKVDPVKEWEVLKKYLEDKPETISELRNAIRTQADMARRAKELALMANTEYQEFLLKHRDRKQLWRTAAMEYWQAEKESGLHKQITESMLEDWMIENHSELYTELETRKLHLEEVCDRLKALATQVSNKGQNLRKLLESETRRPSGLPGWADDDKNK